MAHSVVLASEMGRQNLSNGDLIARTEQAGFDLLISSDQNIRYQQTLIGRRIALLILPIQNWPALKPHARKILLAVNNLQAGECRELDLS
jgi:hypothetical protein